MHDVSARVRLLSIALVLGALAVAPAPAQAGLGIASFGANVSTSQAGAHPDFSTSFALDTEALGNPIGQLRDATITLPQGLVGNPQAIERCAIKSLATFVCPRASQVGVISLSVVVCQGLSTPLEATAEAGATTLSVPNADAFCTEEASHTVTVGTGATAEQDEIVEIVNVTTVRLATPLIHSHSAGEPVTHVAAPSQLSVSLFNVEPSTGHVATFAASLLLADIYVQVNVGANGQVTATLSETSTLLPVQASTITLWGVPAAPSHDARRCSELIPEECGPSSAEPAPFITNPTACTGPLEAELSVTSWQGEADASTATLPTPTGCEKLTLAPTLAVTPSTTQRDTPAGYEIDLRLPQEEEPYGLATPALKTARVSLPPGTSLSPGLANGLQTCGPQSLAEDKCPDASKIGTAEITTPLLPDRLTGGIYVGTPTPSEKYRVVLSVSADDTTIRLEGQAETNEATGQVTAVFNNLPQLPFSDVRLVFFGGPAAAFANPPTCGLATSTSQITSYAGQSADPSSTFVSDGNGEGEPCPANHPFAPTVVAGTTFPLAGRFTPLTLAVSRADGEPSLSTFAVQLPLGLEGLLKTVPLCSGTSAAEGTCGQVSEVGTATIGAGAGPQPLYVSGHVYLTGPYDGAPFGLAIVMNVSAGPFSLGKAVVRARILVDPTTLALTIASDPFPQVLGGIPLRIRTVNLVLSRPGFLSNPTSCAAQKITGTIVSGEGANATFSTPFQVYGCGELPFAPKVTASTQGNAQFAGHGASLTVRIAMPRGVQANVRSATIDLPTHLLARLSTIQQACPAATFAAQAGACPSASLVGQGTVSSPALAAPLTGPIYLVSHAKIALPDLVMVLHGQGITLVLSGVLEFSSSGTISATFGTVPDVPISTFELSLPEGAHSALSADGTVCSSGLILRYRITGQNGTRIQHATKVAVSACPRKHRRKTAKRV